MKLVACIVHNRDKNKVCDELVKAGFKFTVIGTTGGFLREGNTTFLIGTEADGLDNLMEVVAQNCQTREQMVTMMPFEATSPGALIHNPMKVPVGGAVVFVLNVERFERF